MEISKFEEGSERSSTQNKKEWDKKYDLEERTASFAERVRDFCLRLLRNAAYIEYIPQLPTALKEVKMREHTLDKKRKSLF
jgi:hypothetical protein